MDPIVHVINVLVPPVLWNEEEHKMVLSVPFKSQRDTMHLIFPELPSMTEPTYECAK